MCFFLGGGGPSSALNVADCEGTYVVDVIMFCGSRALRGRMRLWRDRMDEDTGGGGAEKGKGARY